MRAKITQDPHGNVRMTYSNDQSALTIRIFVVKQTEHLGYVWERLTDGRLIQVCERLDSRGTTLMSDRTSLLALIRKEWRRQRQRDLAYFAQS